MESGSFLQPVLHRIGYTAAHGAAGEDHTDMGIVQNAKGSKQTGGKGFYIGFFAVRKGITVFIQGKLFLKAQHPVAGFVVSLDVGSGLFPAAGYDDHLAIGGIVPVLHTGCLDARILIDLGSNSLVHHKIAQHFDQLLRRDTAGAQQPGPFLS